MRSPLSFALFFVIPSGLSAGPIATGYASLQEAIDQNPGRMIEVPAGDYQIASPLQMKTDHSGLFGPGRIVQTNPDAAILSVVGRTDIQIREVTLTRPDRETENKGMGLEIDRSSDVVIEGVSVLGNRSRVAAMEINRCHNVSILNCRVANYMCISVDDRTDSKDWGYAFKVIDGTGINSNNSSAVLIQGNSILEDKYIPTPELQKQYDLGRFTKTLPQKGLLVSQQMWDAGYSPRWHQGAAIGVHGPEHGDYIQVLGNYVHNGAQGIDCHSDHVIIANNIINNSFMGMKAMHGARNVLISANQFSRNDLWSIGLMPGAASRPAGVVAHDGETPGQCPANVDGGHIVAHNIISDFGFGTAWWMRKDDYRAALKFDTGQKPFNPPLTDVIVDGNVVYDTGRDGILENGKVVIEPPRFVHAVQIVGGPGGPKNIQFSANIFASGSSGISSVPIKP